VYKNATYRILAATVLLAPGVLAQAPAALPGLAQSGLAQPGLAQVDWRHVGNSAIDRSLAGLATGPVDRVWFSSVGSLLIHTPSGRVFETTDFEAWKPSTASVPPEPATTLARVPESGARLRARSPSAPVLYSVSAKFAYRSENEGSSWDNLTGFRGRSILGEGLSDLAVSPVDDDQIVAAGANGVFRSMDGGKSWSSLNRGLPNLPATRLMSLPSGDHGVRLALPDASEVEWQPGQKTAWAPVDNTDASYEKAVRQVFSTRLHQPVSSYAALGDYVYVGLAAGGVSASTDGGQTYRQFGFNEAGAVERFWVDPNDPRVALAVLGSRQRDLASTAQRVYVVRTENGGLFWDNFTSNLPDAGVHGIAADRASGAIYAATDAGVFMTYANLGTLGIAPQWHLLPGLPGAATDVKLDAQGNQLWAAVDGFGVYSTLAPHRLRDPRVVSTADLVARATAPGSLISILGARVQAAHAGDLQVPVLSATENESQLQIPFEASGTSVSLAVDGANGRSTLPAMALESAAPAIFVDRDGSPVLLDGESGVMLDAMNPAHSRGRVQIMATGLGRVRPDWPTGLAGPLENPPEVVANVKAYLDRQPVEVTRAVLAPYIGYYLVEITVPKIVNYGPAELSLEVNGQASNPVRVYIEP
jgi:uncharacterized protein (TIGR03437 family)